MLKLISQCIKSRGHISSTRCVRYNLQAEAKTIYLSTFQSGNFLWGFKRHLYSIESLHLLSMVLKSFPNSVLVNYLYLLSYNVLRVEEKATTHTLVASKPQKTIHDPLSLLWLSYLSNWPNPQTKKQKRPEPSRCSRCRPAHLDDSAEPAGVAYVAKPHRPALRTEPVGWTAALSLGLAPLPLHPGSAVLRTRLQSPGTQQDSVTRELTFTLTRVRPVRTW